MLNTKTLFASASLCLAMLGAPLVTEAMSGMALAQADDGAIVQKIRSGETRDLQWGRYKWRVLEVKDDMALLLTEKLIGVRQFHATRSDIIRWPFSSLRDYLNTEFLNEKFSAEQQKLIAGSTVRTPDKRNSKTLFTDSKDIIFILSEDEVKKYFPKESDRMLGYEYWLRTPGTNWNNVCMVDKEGKITPDGTYDNGKIGIRPALWIKL
jgi:hypothetical protein